MADNNIYFPDDMEKMKKKCAQEKNKETGTDADIGYDGHIVFEDEMDKIKNKANASKATDTNSLEDPPTENATTPNAEDERIHREMF